MEQMSSIRDQQESLAKLHFEIGARQDPSAPLSEEGKDLKFIYSEKATKFCSGQITVEIMQKFLAFSESLAKLHFEIGARQDPSAPLSEEGKDLKFIYSEKATKFCNGQITVEIMQNFLAFSESLAKLHLSLSPKLGFIFTK